MPEISCRLNRRITPQWRQCYEEIPHIRHQRETSKHQPLVAHLSSPLKSPKKIPLNPLEISLSCFKLHRFPMKKTNRTSASRTWRWSSRVLTCGSTHFRVGCDLGRSMADHRHGHFVFFRDPKRKCPVFGGKETGDTWCLYVFIGFILKKKYMSVPLNLQRHPTQTIPKPCSLGNHFSLPIPCQAPFLFPSHCIKSSSNGAWLAGSDRGNATIVSCKTLSTDPEFSAVAGFFLMPKIQDLASLMKGNVSRKSW